ncbi:B-cell scaffold protein with ankyrin repeats-like [Polypterus senegalus]|uniref:B-cell scaffold protein with ankyrin repeats-like n=1 Tax=Polypterus senegalus TaxID=55291 RepID=UPI001962A167|nr:B-cell scaffold protein with ankyrin repeats-like [Polypterus senegalus]
MSHTKCKMSFSDEQLVIIYEADAEQWATYLKSVLAEKIDGQNICCHDIGQGFIKKEDFLKLSLYKCKILILSKGMLDVLRQIKRFFLARALWPINTVVILRCGVTNSKDLYDILPIGNECLEMSSEQDPEEYLAVVTRVIERGANTTTPVISSNQKRGAMECVKGQTQSTEGPDLKSSVLVVPRKIQCECPGDIFILFQDGSHLKDMEIEFQSNIRKQKVKPLLWNQNTLRVKALDFPAGVVHVNIYFEGTLIANVELFYYTTMGQIENLLNNVADPVSFSCQALGVSSTKELDHLLTSSLKNRMPASGLEIFQTHYNQKSNIPVGNDSEELPTLLHFAAKNGLRNLSTLLLQCPGAEIAIKMTNKNGESPVQLAEKNNHAQLKTVLEDMLIKLECTEDHVDESIYELMHSAPKHSKRINEKEPTDVKTPEEDESDLQEEDPYTLVGKDDDVYDMILTSNKNFSEKSRGASIINRPPAPAPRPPKSTDNEDSTPYIAKVFQQKSAQGDNGALYSNPLRQFKGRDSLTSTYDTFIPRQPFGLDQLVALQERVKRNSITVDEALEKFSDWQKEQMQRGMDLAQQLFTFLFIVKAFPPCCQEYKFNSVVELRL